MLNRMVIVVPLVAAVVFFSVFAAVPVYAGGIAAPPIQEERVEPQIEQDSELPVFDYQDSKMPVDYQFEPEAKEKTWVWVVLGFVAAVFVTSL